MKTSEEESIPASDYWRRDDGPRSTRKHVIAWIKLSEKRSRSLPVF